VPIDYAFYNTQVNISGISPKTKIYNLLKRVTENNSDKPLQRPLTVF
jgi:hypothetical protein